MTHRWGARRRAAITTLLLMIAAIHSAISASQNVVRLPAFRDIAASAGIDFVPLNGASEQRFLPEVIGSGGLFFDFDNDGWLDVFLVDGGSVADAAVARRARHRLYRNRARSTLREPQGRPEQGRGTAGSGQAPSASSEQAVQFEDVTATSGLTHRGYGMGACAGDVDNDGLVDLYVTSVGENALYRNAGKGRFAEVPNAGGANPHLWSTSCAFLDIDRDGDLDLFVTNYVDDSRGRNEFCGMAGPPPVRDYCHPLTYQPLHSVLYRNTGKGTFEDISKPSGIGSFRGNGLGVAVADVDDDGWPDIFVANDAMPNFLFRNRGDGTFTDIGSLSGVAVGADGKAKAGMGTAFADFSGNGRLGLVVTNHESEMHSLFQNEGGGVFSDVTLRSGVGPATRPFVGFGVVPFDFDNDGWLDIAIANGHVVANAPLLRHGSTFAQRNLLLRNVDGRFRDMKTESGPGFSIERVSRGLAAGDIDNDGDLDLLITNNGAAPNLLLNEGGSSNSVLVRLIGVPSTPPTAGPSASLPSTPPTAGPSASLPSTPPTAGPSASLRASTRDAIGARLTLTTGNRRQLREVQSGSSYLAQNDLRVHFGLGQATRAEQLQIRWPSGRTELIKDLPANHVVTIREGEGVVARVPLRLR